MKILAFRDGIAAIADLIPYVIEENNSGDEVERVVDDHNENGELFSVFAPAHLMFPNGEFTLVGLQDELDSKIIAITEPYSPSLTLCPFATIQTLEALGFDITWPIEWLEEIDAPIPLGAIF
ncbi:hypothetical protein [Edwardsiella tarda]|uniref:hypothetical protein n=1 Tax=Edwardsiella tarda TaxID=636 RepID=UPI00351C741F